MKILMISTDRAIFDKESSVRTRMIEYGELFDQLHIVIFSLRNHRKHSDRLSENVWVYPTNSFSRLGYVYDAYRISRRILKEVRYPEAGWITSTQDPFETGLVGKWIKKRIHIPLQIQVHTDIGSIYFKKHSFLNRIRLWIAKKVISHADTVRVVSKRIKDTLIQVYGVDSKKIQLLPIWVDGTYFKDGFVDSSVKKRYPQFGVTILMASRLAIEKNIALGVRVFKNIHTRYPEAGLVIVGKGKEDARLKKYVNDLGIAHKVVFEPWARDMRAYYESADIFLLTSDYEGYGLTLVEASLSGCAILSTDVGIAGSLLISGESSFVCPVQDELCLSEHLFQLLSSEDMRRRLGLCAQNTMLKYMMSKDTFLKTYRRNVLSALEGDE